MASIVARPTTKDELLYQSATGFVSSVTVGGDAPNGVAHTLSGSASTLLELINAEKHTILNFGSCT